ncbi:hypothetical protein E2C01_096985 [Portunus trituberculatus]|uniref:Uncharacterized protein n=1 Tax=Portunus trituberculatus TaxID=210409 RepID=A0A5B7K3F1_PORTR|nr:hypothetical protein [Portunus trituberculatus]
MRTNRFKKKAIHDAECLSTAELRPLPPKASHPGHPTIQHTTAPIGRSLQRVALLVHWQPTQELFSLAPHWQPY